MSHLKLSLLSIAMLFPAVSVWAKSYPLKSWNELGVKAHPSNGTSSRYEFYDIKSKIYLIQTYDQNHVIASSEVRNALGVVLEKTRFLPNRLWKQTPGQLNEWFVDSKGRDMHRLTALATHKKVYELPYKRDVRSADSCLTALDQDLAGVKSLTKALDSSTSDLIGNTKIKTSGCKDYAGGEAGLLKEMKEALDEGLPCMMAASPESKVEAMKLRAMFENKNSNIQIFCGASGTEVDVGGGEMKSMALANAEAIIPPEKGSPGMLINLWNAKKTTPEQRKSTLFHEMLHWLGITHGEGFDTPYIAQGCCMNVNKEVLDKEIACRLLNASPRPSADSKEYLEQLGSSLLLKGSRSSILSMMRASMGRQMAKTPVDLSEQFWANQKFVEYTIRESRFQSLVMKRLDPNLTEPVNMPSDKKAYNEVSNMTADLVAMMYRKESGDAFVAQAAKVKAKYKAVMASNMPEAEKDALKLEMGNWVDDYHLLSFDLQSRTNAADTAAYDVWYQLDKD